MKFKVVKSRKTSLDWSNHVENMLKQYSECLDEERTLNFRKANYAHYLKPCRHNQAYREETNNQITIPDMNFRSQETIICHAVVVRGQAGTCSCCYSYMVFVEAFWRLTNCCVFVNGSSHNDWHNSKAHGRQAQSSWRSYQTNIQMKE